MPPVRRLLGLGRTSAPASSSLFAVANVVRANPTSHRAQLRKQLQEQARHQGATWLARELGYKDFREHQRDLKIMELKRKAMSSRLKAREEEEQRQRIASRPQNQDGEEEDEDGDEEYKGEEVRHAHRQTHWGQCSLVGRSAVAAWAVIVPAGLEMDLVVRASC